MPERQLLCRRRHAGNALTYNGSSWSSPSDIDGSNIPLLGVVPERQLLYRRRPDRQRLHLQRVLVVVGLGHRREQLPRVGVVPERQLLCRRRHAGNAVTYGTPPTTGVLIPATGAKLSGFAYLDAFASTNATSVQFRLGVSGPVVCTTMRTLFGWLCAWNTTTVPNGSYVLFSEAFTRLEAPSVRASASR